MTLPRRHLVAMCATALATLAGAVAVTVPAAGAAATGCRVDYTISSQWQGGFGANVAITNLGDPVNGWTLGWTFTAGQTVTQAWNATVTQSGTAVTARNVSYNGALPTNGTASFGFNGSWTTGNPVPSTFTVNGTTCTGTPAPTECPPPSTGGPSPSPSTGPTTPPAQPKVTVWLAGDSTMANPSGGTCPVGWGSQFAPYFNSNVTVRNNAVSGRSIQTWLYDPNVTATKDSTGECVINPNTYSTRWTSMLDASAGMKSGDYLIVQFGINDGDSACPRHVGSARYKQLLGVMVAAAKQRGVRPILLTPVAAITCSGGTAVGNRGFLTETTDAAAANGVPVIDLHRLSYGLYNSLGLCPNNGDYAQGKVGAFFCNDHTHFETAGATQIAGLVATALRNQNIPLAGYLR
ncbi:cellulose binding domain-containing protein [Micromonospora zhanjiangensis]